MRVPPIENEVLVLTGPTASGKSSLAHRLALLGDAEIVSCDSRQVYRELTIGSAKPDPGMLCEVRYHFIDEKELTEPFSAGEYALEAEARILGIIRRGKRAIVVGGSALYLQGLVEGFAGLPPKNAKVRQLLERQLADFGAERLYERLRKLDPQQAATLDPTKTQRLVRSLEIIETTGRSVTELQRTHTDATTQKWKPNYTLFALLRPREELYGRINLRTEQMMHEGLLEEAEGLWRRYQREIEDRSLPSLCTVGYQELFEHFRGKTTLDEAVALIQQHTRNYAKRQLTFMRNRLQCRWVPATIGSEELLGLL
ncbi:tRNA (adenosine(37)-N6)-dimethylallyltransferase MiaA [Chlorobium sp. N1]|uniref:tRNA (adenosine(37)-N6)-dimethylallyltransferase MiaA n=1 Tax=Chlorobium sp. N1 TaxID=2491138 RepID=UPI001F611C88|nr:tRNA (adenosine(37)-N6)-dimethylallyltransferase MiaA [Chlorobium sp. N1]